MSAAAKHRSWADSLIRLHRWHGRRSRSARTALPLLKVRTCRRPSPTQGNFGTPLARSSAFPCSAIYIHALRGVSSSLSGEAVVLSASADRESARLGKFCSS